MSYAMYCATHGPQEMAPCPTCGAWHTDPRPETPADHDRLRNAINAVRDTEPDVEHAREQMERLGIAVKLADEARDRREANQLREYLRLPEGGVSTRAVIALAMQDKGASAEDLHYAEALMRSNGWLPPEERAAEHEIHGLCPGHPIANDPAATCSVCNMSRVTFDKLCAALRSPEGQQDAPDWERLVEALSDAAFTEGMNELRDSPSPARLTRDHERHQKAKANLLAALRGAR